MSTTPTVELPGLNCGLCGYKTCDELSERLPQRPELLQRCIHLSEDKLGTQPSAAIAAPPNAAPSRMAGSAPPVSECGSCAIGEPRKAVFPGSVKWLDSLGREFDFYLEHFPEEPGPREIIIPHNPMITREMDIQKGDIILGRPLGMSCGCPITHCGVVTEVDHRTGVIVWCVTGPLAPREKGFKDLGYYIAEGYEGLITEARCDIKIGMRYYFQPRMCMLQWRHSGLVNFLNRTPDALQVRVEGLWIG
jgi:uncharacterized Fe-S cluster-containing protein